jgi:hypothetical protein
MSPIVDFGSTALDNHYQIVHISRNSMLPNMVRFNFSLPLTPPIVNILEKIDKSTAEFAPRFVGLKTDSLGPSSVE